MRIYHCDHRNTATRVQDATYLIGVPLWCPDVPVPEVNEAIAAAFDAEISAALTGEASSLRMLPAGFGSELNLAAHRAVVVNGGGYEACRADR